MAETLFDVPDDWWHYRACPVCGGPLSVTSTHTYAMQRQGWVKVGASSNVLERLGVLRRSTLGCLVRTPAGMDLAEPLLLLAVLEGDVEHELHRRFAHAHAAGEWFLPDRTMRGWLDLLPKPDMGG